MGGERIPTDESGPAEPTSQTAEAGLHVGLRALVHVVYWPLYACTVVPFQLAGRVARYLQYNPSLAHCLKDAFGLLKYALFFTNRDRAVLFLRASWLWTPGTVLPFMPGEKIINEDPTVETGPFPENWDDIRTTAFRRDDYTCTCCGARGGPHGDTELHADHIVPRSRDGPDTPDNLRTLCRLCHQARHARFFSD